MSDPLTVAVPDIGDFGDVPVIDVLVAPGDRVDVENAARHPGERQGDDGRAIAARGHRGIRPGHGRGHGIGRRGAACPGGRIRCGDAGRTGCGTSALPARGADPARRHSREIRAPTVHGRRRRDRRRRRPPTSRRRSWCSGRDRAATPAAFPRRRPGTPHGAGRAVSDAPAGCASTSGASPRRRSSTPPRSSTGRRRWRRTASRSGRRRSTSRSSRGGRTRSWDG